MQSRATNSRASSPLGPRRRLTQQAVRTSPKSSVSRTAPHSARSHNSVDFHGPSSPSVSVGQQWMAMQAASERLRRIESRIAGHSTADFMLRMLTRVNQHPAEGATATSFCDVFAIALQFALALGLFLTCIHCWQAVATSMVGVGPLATKVQWVTCLATSLGIPALFAWRFIRTYEVMPLWPEAVVDASSRSPPVAAHAAGGGIRRLEDAVAVHDSELHDGDVVKLAERTPTRIRLQVPPRSSETRQRRASDQRSNEEGSQRDPSPRRRQVTGHRERRRSGSESSAGRADRGHHHDRASARFASDADATNAATIAHDPLMNGQGELNALLQHCPDLRRVCIVSGETTSM